MSSITLLTQKIADISECEMQKILDEFKVQSKNNKDYSYVQDSLSTGTNEKDAYVWFDVKYKNTCYTIGSVWIDVSEENYNVRHYYGQISFTKNQYEYEDKTFHPNKCCTTISQLYERADYFKDFLNRKGYQTINQVSNKKPLTIDSIHNNTVSATEVYTLFDEWVKL